MPDLSELSSIAETLDQLTKRITAMAERAAAEKENGAAAELFSIERTLLGAGRRMTRILSGRR